MVGIFRFIFLVAILFIWPLYSVAELTADLKFTATYNHNNFHASSKKNLRGWDHLTKRMILAGVNAKRAEQLFSDRRLPVYETVLFKVPPKESMASYAGHNSKKARMNALEFYRQQRKHFVAAEKNYHVPQSIILAILQVESQCGKVTGKHSVFYRLARLAAMADPLNIAANKLHYQRQKSKVSEQTIEKRALWLEETFLPHLIATIKLADRLGQHPFDIKGSIAGALGLPQFLPGNIFKYGVDANKDGKIDIYQPADAIYSIANFLSAHGWTKKTVSWTDRSNVLHHYNRSKPYVNTVLNMALHLRTYTK